MFGVIINVFILTQSACVIHKDYFGFGVEPSFLIKHINRPKAVVVWSVIIITANKSASVRRWFGFYCLRQQTSR